MLARRRLCLLLVCVLPAFTPAAAQVTINVDAAQNRHPIDPRIYGVAFADAATISDLGLPLNRWGGNWSSRYNWAINTSNHARDWYFENIVEAPSSDAFTGATLGALAQPIITIPVMGYLPFTQTQNCSYSIAKYAAGGCCAARAPDVPDCGNGFDAANPANPLKFVNNPLDVAQVFPASHQTDWIGHNITTFGSAATTGVKYYAIDNEPDLWDSTHFDIHPAYSTYDEIWGKTQEYAPLIKTKDPASLVMGPEVSGWAWYFDSALGWKNNHNDLNNHGGVYFVPWLLQQARAYELANGVRILDMLSLHWYPQGRKNTTVQEYNPGNPAEEVTDTTKLLRNQSTRSLWDPAYVDQSWISDLGLNNNIPRLIPLMHDWVNANYPGTKIGITEYNWGAEHDANGAAAQADILGIFGREALDFATRWTSPPSGSNVYNAYRMYRNYDGSHSTFGDVSVSAAAPNPDNVATFAAQRTSDGALTIMVINKQLTTTTTVTVDVANFTAGGAAQVWQLANTNAISHPPDISGSPIVLIAPPGSVTLLVVPRSVLAAPTGVVATASSNTIVAVSWNTVAGALSYQVYRSSNIVAGFAALGAPTTLTSIADSGLTPDTTYLYRVQAISGGASSALSAIDAATTTMFTDDPLVAGAFAKTAHMSELRTAVNAMRAAAGLGAQAFTDDPLTSGTAIKAVHVQELRTALDQARGAIGLSALAYTDPAITAGVTALKTAHVTDLRNGVK